jgi:hypothetical protein
MDIAQLQRMGLHGNNPLIKKTITIHYYPLLDESPDADPAGPRAPEQVEGTVDFWIRKFMATDRIATMQLSHQNSHEEATLLAVQRSIFHEDGKPMFPDIESVRILDLEVYAPILMAINDINGDSGKKSQPRTNGGTRLPSPSADAQSQSGKKASRKKRSITGSNSQTSTAP